MASPKNAPVCSFSWNARTAPIPVEAWLFVVPFAAVMLALEELRKRFARRAAEATAA